MERNNTFFRHKPGAVESQLLVPLTSQESKKVTVLDLWSLPEGITDDAISLVVSKKTGLNLDKIEDRRELASIMGKAREFMWEALELELAGELEDRIATAQKIPSLSNIINVIRMAERKDTRRSVHHAGPLACAFLKVCLAVREIRNKKLDDLRVETQAFQWDMVTKFLGAREASRRASSLHPDLKEDHFAFEIPNKADEGIPIFLQTRPKSEQSSIIKMINYVDERAERVITDGIGLAIYVEDENDLEKVLRYIVESITKQSNAFGFFIKNQGGLAQARMETLNRHYIQSPPNGKEIKVGHSARNPKSNAERSTVSLKFQIPRTKRGKKDTGADLPIEIQFDILKPKNPYYHHSVYEAQKKLSALTRLFGYVKETKLESIIDGVLAEYDQVEYSGLKAYLLGFMVELPSMAKGKRKFMHKDQVGRIFEEEPQLIPTAIREQVKDQIIALE